MWSQSSCLPHLFDFSPVCGLKLPAPESQSELNGIPGLTFLQCAAPESKSELNGIPGLTFLQCAAPESKSELNGIPGGPEKSRWLQLLRFEADAYPPTMGSSMRDCLRYCHVSAIYKEL